jgi:hypothetical protein
LKVPLEGHHHSGLDDCKTIVNILTELLSHSNRKKFHYFSQFAVPGLEKFVEEIPLDYDPLTDTSISDFGGWFTNKTLNLQGGKISFVVVILCRCDQVSELLRGRRVECLSFALFNL